MAPVMGGFSMGPWLGEIFSPPLDFNMGILGPISAWSEMKIGAPFSQKTFRTAMKMVESCHP